MSGPRLPGRLGDRICTGQGLEIPCVGLGVFRSPVGAPTRQSVAWALEEGYRHIDTAAMYGNESDVGEAVRASGIPREEIVVTTKLWHTDHGFDSALASARRSQERLGLGPIDLYLIHWPTAPSPETRLASWRALEKLRRDGVVRAIGVANYTIRHLEELRAASEIVPAVDQVEYHPFVYDPELERYLAGRGIVLEAYSPLTRGHRLTEPVVREVARAHDRTPAQVLLRWGLEHGCVELPKSNHHERIVENGRLFDFALSEEEQRRLNALATGERTSTTDPRQIP